MGFDCNDGVPKPRRYRLARLLRSVSIGLSVLPLLGGYPFYKSSLNAQESIQKGTSESSDSLIDVLPRANQVSPSASFKIELSPAKAKPGATVTLRVTGQIHQGWHIGVLEQDAIEKVGYPTKIELELDGLEAIDSKYKCSAEPEKISVADMTMLCLSDTFTWTRRFQVKNNTASYSAKGAIRFQACNDQICQPPKSLAFALGKPNEAETQSQELKQPSNEKPIGEPLVLPLEPSEKTRIRPQLSLSNALFGRPKENLIWMAKVPTGPGTSANLYLPKSKRFILKNTGNTDTITESTATYVSIDQDGNGEISSWESCSSGSPIRIHDSMYRIVSINLEQSTITLQKLDAPLRGSLVGRRCPDFEFTTLDGQTVSNKTIQGKVTILDVWAVTCHNCYEGFPHVQRLQDKYSADKLNVILLSVDGTQSLYDSQAPALFQSFGGAKWPSVRVASGFSDILPIGDFGFGSVVIDKNGIVRAVGTRGEELENTLARAFADDRSDL